MKLIYILTYRIEEEVSADSAEAKQAEVEKSVKAHKNENNSNAPSGNLILISKTIFFIY